MSSIQSENVGFGGSVIISVKINAVLLDVPGKLVLSTSGDINIYADILQTGLFSIVGSNGWERISFVYALA